MCFKNVSLKNLEGEDEFKSNTVLYSFVMYIALTNCGKYWGKEAVPIYLLESHRLAHTCLLDRIVCSLPLVWIYRVQQVASPHSTLRPLSHHLILSAMMMYTTSQPFAFLVTKCSFYWFLLDIMLNYIKTLLSTKNSPINHSVQLFKHYSVISDL